MEKIKKAKRSTKIKNDLKFKETDYKEGNYNYIDENGNNIL